jgi:iron complex transport system permease protein
VTLTASPALATADPSPAPRGSGARVLVLLGALAAVAVLALLSLAVGSRSLPTADVLRSLVAPDGSETSVIVRELRLPRTVVALVVGAAVGLAGAQLQGLTRNPLADPGLLGVSAGAAFAVVVGTALGLTGAAATAGLAVVGALAASIAVPVLGGAGRRGSSPATLALAGVALSALLLGIVSGIVLLDVQTLDAYRFWAVGSVAGRDLAVLAAVLPLLLVGALLALVNAPALDLLSLGDDVAQGLGVSVLRTRLVGLGAVSLLTAGATAVAGPVAFVGLVAPHVARALTGPAHVWLVPVSALGGAVLVVLADVLGRVVARPGEVQVGVVLALLGAPFFIALVRRRRLVGV